MARIRVAYCTLKRARTDELTTSEVAELLRITPATVKRWADAELLPSTRTAGGHRRFERAAIEKQHPHPPLVTGLETDRWVDQLLHSDDGLSLDGALMTERSKVEGWFAVAEEFGPALDELGRRWEQGTLSILEEHVVSARLSRGLGRIAASLPVRSEAPRVFLATLEGEAHTLGLSLAELCVREWGWKTTWAGRETPTSELERLASRGGAAALVLSASICGDPSELAEAARHLGAVCRSARVGLLMGGRGPWPDPPPFGVVLRNFRELRRWMARLERGHLG